MPTPVPDQYLQVPYPVKFSADVNIDQAERSTIDKRGGCWAEINRCYDLVGAIKATGFDFSSLVPNPGPMIIGGGGHRRNRHRNTISTGSLELRIQQLELHNQQLEADLKEARADKLGFERQSMVQISYVEDADKANAYLLRKSRDLSTDISSFTNFGTYLNHALETSTTEQVHKAKLQIQEAQTFDILGAFMEKTSIEDPGEDVTKKITTCLKSIFDLKSLASSSDPAQLSEVLGTARKTDLVDQMVVLMSLLKLDEGQGNGHDMALVATMNVHSLDEDNTESDLDAPSVKRLKSSVDSNRSNESDESSTTSAVPSQPIIKPTVTADFAIYDAVKEQFGIDGKTTHTFDVSTVPEIMDLERFFLARAASSLGVLESKVKFIVKRERLDEPNRFDVSDEFTYRSWANCMVQLQGFNKRCMVFAYGPNINEFVAGKAARRID